MRNRTWALLGLATVVALALGAWTVTSAQAWSNAVDRHDRADDLQAVASADQQRVDARLLDAQQTLTEDQAVVGDQRSYFAPAVLTAVTGVQADTVATVCAQARTATRDSTALPESQAALDRAVAAAASRPALAGLGLDDQWARFLQPGEVQAEIDSCAADEAAQIEAERQAELAAQRSSNCGAPLFPEDSCPTDAELAAEQQAEALCGGGHYDQAAALGIDCGPIPAFP